MKICAISDLHGHYPSLDRGDLLIVAGDVCASDDPREYFKFFHWIANQPYKKMVLVGGNHDNFLEEFEPSWCGDFEWLKDSGTEFEGVKIWGSPWTHQFHGQNEMCKAFSFDHPEKVMQKFSLIPKETDILVTHSPAYGILDETLCKESVGSLYLSEISTNKIMPALHIFGHIHESYGQVIKNKTLFVNASHVNHQYKPVNPPVYLEWDGKNVRSLSQDL